MKVHVSVVIITLLFGLGGLAAGGQTAEENKVTPPPQATRSNGSNARRDVDQPVQVSSPKGAATASPASASQQQAPPISPKLEESLVGLTEAVTNLVKKLPEPEKVPSEGRGFLTVLLGAIAAGLPIVFFFFDRRKPSWFQKNKPMFIIIISLFFVTLLAFVLLGLFYLFSGFVMAVFYGFIAIIILLITGLVAAAHLLTFIDNNPGLKRRIIKYSSESPGAGLV